MNSGFTRQEALAISGITAGRLSYLDRIELVVPHKIGNLKHPRVIYSAGQVIELRVISRLRSDLSLQEVRKVIELLRNSNYERSLFTRPLAFVENELHLIEDWQQFGMMILKIARQNGGRVSLCEVDAIGEVMSDLREEAEKHQILDFEKRIRDTPLAA